MEFSVFALQSISPLAPQLQILAISGAALFNWLTSVIIKHLWFTINATQDTLCQIHVYLCCGFIVFFEYKNNSALLHFNQFFAVSENGSTDWS